MIQHEIKRARHERFENKDAASRYLNDHGFHQTGPFWLRGRHEVAHVEQHVSSGVVVRIKKEYH